MGGICLYKTHVDAGVTDKWLANSVARRMSSVLGDNVGAILAKPSLWVCFVESMSDSFPPDIKGFQVMGHLYCPLFLLPF